MFVCISVLVDTDQILYMIRYICVYASTQWSVNIVKCLRDNVQRVATTEHRRVHMICVIVEEL